MKFLNNKPRSPRSYQSDSGWHPTTTDEGKISISVLRNKFDAKEIHAVARYHWLMLKIEIFKLRQEGKEFSQISFLLNRLEKHIIEIKKHEDECDERFYSLIRENIALKIVK